MLALRPSLAGLDAVGLAVVPHNLLALVALARVVPLDQLQRLLQPKHGRR